MRESRIRIGLFGAAPDTPNMGVSALYHSFLSTLSKLDEKVEVVVFDYGRGMREEVHTDTAGSSIRLIRCGVRTGLRMYRSENIKQVSLASRLRIGSKLNPVVHLIDSCDAIADVSAGDSFSDVYGDRRFLRMLVQKQVVLRRKRPLVLLPQTYGPFFNPLHLDKARSVIASACGVWTRDDLNHHYLRNLLSERYDSTKHHRGVDMAFSLEPRQPGIHSKELDVFISSPKQKVGINVNGLVWHGSPDNEFSFNANYKELLTQFISWIVEETESLVLLIPHVLDLPGNPESDFQASVDLVKGIPNRFQGSVSVAPTNFDGQELKWLISKCDWFCGTRMHSTIASLSSGIPTSSIIYSDKAIGVFACCGQESQIVDPRSSSTLTALEKLKTNYAKRAETKTSLEAALPAVFLRAEKQMKEICECLFQG